MNVLGISGSPKENGFTNILLDEALKGAHSEGATIEKVLLNNLQIKPCQDCGICEAGKPCPILDDVSLVYGKIMLADAIIIASPIYFGSVSAQLKAFIDRAQYLWARKSHSTNREPPSSKRRGIFLCVAGGKDKSFFKNAKSVIKIFFKVLDVDYHDELFFGNYDAKKDESAAKNIVLKRAFNIGQELLKIKI